MNGLLLVLILQIGLVQGQQDQILSPGVYQLILSDSCTTIQKLYTISTPDLFEVQPDSKTDILCYGDSTGEIFITALEPSLRLRMAR